MKGPSVLPSGVLLYHAMTIERDAELRRQNNLLWTDEDFYVEQPEQAHQQQSFAEYEADVKYFVQNLYRALRLTSEQLVESKMKEPVA